MARVVVDLSLGIADDRLHAPYIIVLAALTIAEDARSVSLSDASHGSCELCGVVGEEEVATVSAESLQRVDCPVRCQSAGEVSPSVSHSDAVAHHPAGSVLLDVEVVDCRGSDECALALVDIVSLEPCHGILLVVRSRIIVGNKHGNHIAALLRLVVDIEPYGLSFRDTAVAVACLYGIRDIRIGRGLLDIIAVYDLVDIGDILVVLDNLDA